MVSVEFTPDELKMIVEAVSELVYEYEHNVEPPSRRGGTAKSRHPDTTALRQLAARLESILGGQ